MESRRPGGLLPEGFFANTEEIYAEVASYSVVPPEKIKQYWNAYTTTFRRLFDPSAFRLENFWWHVWGSDKRYLSGPALARLFEEFSNGPTIALQKPAVNLRADAGASIPRAGKPQEARTTQHSEQSAEHDSTPSGSVKPPTPSSSRPPPLPPILKKTRRPSSGRRPNARFASPPSSGDKGVGNGDAIAPDNAVAVQEMPPPPLPPLPRRKKPAATATAAHSTATTTPLSGADSGAVAPVVSNGQARPGPRVLSAKSVRGATAAGRRIVVASAASRRKPLMLRRSSSQSSGGSDHDQRVISSIRPTSTTHARNTRPTFTPSQLLRGSVSPQTVDPGLSAKAAGKRPASVTMGKGIMPPSASTQIGGYLGSPATQQPHDFGPQRRSTWDATGSAAAPSPGPSRREPPQQHPQIPPPIAGFVADGEARHRAPMLVRSRSNNTEGSPRYREPGLGVLPTQATSSVAMFTTTAHGQFDSETVTSDPVVPEARDIPDSVAFASQPSPDSPLAGMPFRPTPPSPAAPILFGRSRSELTLLLEREKARAGEGS